MKNKKAVAIVMLASMCLSACTSGGNTSGDGGNAVTSESIESSEGAEKTSETTVNTGYPITLVNHAVTSSNEERELCTGSYTEIVLSDEYKEKYPKLAEYVESYNDNTSYEIPERIAEYASWVLEDTFYEDAVYYDENKVNIARIDDRLFSMEEQYESFSGGAHPNHATGSINIDPVTGQMLRLDQVLNDSSILSEAIRTELEKAYPGIMEEVDSFYYQGEDEDPDQFVQKLKDDTYTWSINAEGLRIHFSPYEIASYATGDLDIVLSVKDYPNLIQPAFQMSEAQDMTKIVTRTDAEPIKVEPKESEPIPDSVKIANPTWKSYKAEGVVAGTAHITLTKTKEEKTDFLDTSVWAEKHGFMQEGLTHEDENYFYSGVNEVSYGNTFQGLQIYDTSMEKMYYNFDLSELCDGPDYEEERLSAQNQFIRYATVVDNILYAELGHWGYASEEPWSSYIVAIDVNTNELLFRSEPLVANAGNFKVVGDTIICGYGFTAEPDYIYLLDRFTGEKYDTIPVNSAADQFQIVDDTLYVATYNTEYEFSITR